MSPCPAIRLQHAALDSLDPGWVPGADPSLLERARGSAAGRRWLAGHLASPAPALFATLAGDDALQPALQRAPWLLGTLPPPLRIGVRALAGALRSVVSRLEVNRVRRVLGAAHYRQLLHGEGGGEPAPAGFSAALHSDEALRAYLLCRGAAELIAYADALHAAAGARVRLAFSPQLPPCVPLIAAGRIEALLLAAEGGARG